MSKYLQCDRCGARIHAHEVFKDLTDVGQVEFLNAVETLGWSRGIEDKCPACTSTSPEPITVKPTPTVKPKGLTW